MKAVFNRRPFYIQNFKNLQNKFKLCYKQWEKMHLLMCSIYVCNTEMKH